MPGKYAIIMVLKGKAPTDRRPPPARAGTKGDLTMKYIIVSISTGKHVPAIDIHGEKHWEPLTFREAALAVTSLNREAGAKAYRLESL